MAVQIERRSSVKRHEITLDEYDRMINAGVFNEYARVELIEGEIVDMAPINYPHEACVARLSRLITLAAGNTAYVWPQGNSIRIREKSRPQPDLTLLKWRGDEYSSQGTPPSAEDILLVVEVSGTSLRFDRTRKLALYARAGIPEYWIVNLRQKVIEVYSSPRGDHYEVARNVGRHERLPLPGGLEGSIAVDDVLG